MRGLASIEPLMVLVCFGGVPINLKARVLTEHEGCDVDYFTTVDPWWFNAIGSGLVFEDGSACGFFAAATKRVRSSEAIAGLAGKTVRVTGEFDFPGSEKCTTTPFTDGPRTTITGPEGALLCRIQFVVTEIR